MNSYQGFHSFAPSQDTSPKTIRQSTNASLNVYKFSIHIPNDLLETKNDFNQSKQDNIKVYCRLRPPIKDIDNIKYDTTMLTDGQNCYSFDRIFGKFANQQQVYQSIALRHIDDFLMGYNSTIFAYGQTGSGKTHTMFGVIQDKEQQGIIPRTLQEIFKRDVKKSVITCSMLQIYNEKIMDLLNPVTKHDIKLKQYTEGVLLEGLIQVSVNDQQQLMNLIKLGHNSRKTATTSTNDMSSRSHTVLFLYRNFQSQKIDTRCKLCFIDLAGSQKIRKSKAQGQTLQQAKKINLSLSCLGNVIHALTNGSDHIPYRDSKLTRLLKDSLGGDTKTSIITTCSLDKCDHSQSISTIKFAVRAKKIKNKQKLKSIEVSIQNQVEQLMKELQLMRSKYAEAQKQLIYYKSKQQLEKNQYSQDIPEQASHYQPHKSICLYGGISSRVKTIHNSLKTQ